MSATNCIIVSGNLGGDPEITVSQKGNKLAKVNLAVKRDKDVTDWIPVKVINEKLAELLEKYCHKGSYISVQGALRVDKYQSQGENKVYTYVLAENIQLGPKSSNPNSETTEKSDTTSYKKQGHQSKYIPDDDDIDDVPPF